MSNAILKARHAIVIGASLYRELAVSAFSIWTDRGGRGTRGEARARA